MHDLKSKVLSGLFWRFLERFGMQGIGFVISIILARLLTPADYGVIAMITVFIAVAGVFVNSGFSSALVQKKEVSDTDYASVFYLSLGIACVLYLGLFFSAPWIAKFYDTPVLTGILRLLALSLIFGAANSMQMAVLTREMKFYLTFKVSLASCIASGIVGITLAYLGYGVWALAWSAVAAQVGSTIVCWLTVRWRPRLLFSWHALRQLFGFGSKLLGSSLLDTVFSNLYPLIIGKLYDPATLGHYARGRALPGLAVDSINGTISGVMFPALASCQDDRKRLKEIVRRMMVTASFFVFPMMVGLAVVARPLVVVLLTEKWLPCVPFLQLSCITFAFWPLHVANLQAIVAVGRSDIKLVLEIIKKSLIIIVILVTFRHGVMAMVIGQAILSPLALFINVWPNRRLLNYPILDYLKDLLPAAVLSAGMGAVTWGLQWVIHGDFLLLVSQVTLGAILYIAAAKLMAFESAEYIWRTGSEIIQPRLQQFVEKHNYVQH